MNGQTTYSEKLRDPRWQKKRLEILKRDSFTCTLCGDKETELHIHHNEYLPGKDPWEYDNDNFKTHCKHCHLSVEYIKTLVSSVEFICCFKTKYKGSITVIVLLLNQGDNNQFVYIIDISNGVINPKCILRKEEIELIDRSFKKI